MPPPTLGKNTDEIRAREEAKRRALTVYRLPM